MFGAKFIWQNDQGLIETTYIISNPDVYFSSLAEPEKYDKAKLNHISTYNTEPIVFARVYFGKLLFFVSDSSFKDRDLWFFIDLKESPKKLLKSSFFIDSSN